MLHKMKKIMKKMAYYLGRILIRLYGFKRDAYGSLNEDLIIDWLLDYRKTGKYIDIGANDPEVGSNTRMFYERGWSGINVEPNKKDFEKLKQIRTRDINLNCAVGTGEASYYSNGDHAVGNTCVKELAEERGLKDVKILKLKPLKEIFEENGLVKVDFISIDVETFENEVLRSNDWSKYNADVLCIEGFGYGWLKQYGYEFVFWDGYNSYYKLKNNRMKETLKKIYKNTFKKIFPSAGEIVDSFLINELKDCSRVLDLGCGPSSPLGRIKDKLRPDLYSVGVDNFDPYLEKNKKDKIHSEYVKSDIFNINFPEKSFDCALLIDVIEHFEKDDFLKFLPKLEKIAKKIIVMTPNGFVKQEEYDNNAYQIHKSGWTTEDMNKLGFECFGVSGLKSLRGEHALTKIRPIVIGNMVSNITEPFVYNNSKLAYHLICVKNNK